MIELVSPTGLMLMMVLFLAGYGGQALMDDIRKWGDE